MRTLAEGPQQLAEDLLRPVGIGGGAIIMPGVTIGEDSVIGAGSVVTRDIPVRSLAVGSPAKVIREL